MKQKENATDYKMFSPCCGLSPASDEQEEGGSKRKLETPKARRTPKATAVKASSFTFGSRMRWSSSNKGESNAAPSSFHVNENVSGASVIDEDLSMHNATHRTSTLMRASPTEPTIQEEEK